jgi:single-strand DNA-binding protein
MNLVILKGNLTRDVEVRYTPKGTAIAQFSIATNRRWTTESGEKKDETTFHECRCWGTGGETIGKFFHKGKPILVHGRLDTEKWEDKQTGQPRSKAVITIDHWEFAGDLQGSQSPREGNPPPQRQQMPAAGGQARAPMPADKRKADEFGDGPLTDGLDDDEIPF